MKSNDKITPCLCIGGGLLIYTLPKVKYFESKITLEEDLISVIRNILIRRKKNISLQEASLLSAVLNPLIREKFFTGVYRLDLIRRFNTSLIREENKVLKLRYLTTKFKLSILRSSLLEEYNRNFQMDEPVCVHLLVNRINKENYWREAIDLINNKCFLISFCYWILNINQLSNVWITNFTYSRNNNQSIKSRWQ